MFKTSSLKINTIFRSLKYRNYRLFFTGQSVSLIGTWMQRITMPWLVYSMTGSELLLGIVSFAGQIPTFIFSPFAGVITDRWSKYKVLLITQIISMLLAGILAWLSLSGEIGIWHIIVISVALGCINSFDIPARHSFVIDMVGNREDLGNAIALNSLMFNGARLVGPSIAGIILAATNAGVCFLLNAVSYVFVIFSLLMMTVSTQKKLIRSELRILSELREGLSYAFGFPPIKHILLLLTLVSLTGMSYQVLMPVYAQDVLNGESQAYGFLMGAAGLGALTGAIFLASRTTVLKLGRVIPLAAILLGGGLILLSFNRMMSLAIILMIIIGTGMMLQSAASNTILQTITDDDKRGRVMSFYSMSIMGTAPFGSLLAGALARSVGASWTAIIFGVCSIIGGLLFFKKLPELRKSVRPIYIKLGIIPEVAEGIQKSENTAEPGM